MTTENDLIRRSAVGKAGLRAGRRRSRALARVVPTVAPLALLASFPATAAAASPAPAKESAAAPAPAQEPAARPPRAISSKPAGTPTPLYDASGQSLTAHLLTVGPGDAVEEIFGHNALLVRDTVTGYEAAFNYGLFDPNAAGFVFNFFMGNMMYRVAPLPLDATLASARFKNRTVWAQELDLEPAAKAALLDNLLTAALPSNMHYRYQYFLDNCSTRIRDAIDGVLDGQIRAATEGVAPSRVTWRDHTRRLAGEQLHLYAGIDLLLGPRGDAATDLWQEMWVPMKLRDTLASLYVTGADGVRRRLVRSEEVWVQSDRGPEPIAPRSSRALFLGIGAALAAMLIAADARARRGSRVAKMGLASLGVLWGGFCLVAGMVLLAMHATDHEFMHWNRNILVFSPLGAGVAAALVGVARRGAVAVWARRACIGALGLAVLALILHLLPWGRQENLMMIAVAMPVHLAVCLVVGRTFGEAKGSQADPAPTRGIRLDRILAPEPYRSNPIMFGTMDHTFLHVGAGDLVVGFGGTPFLLRVADSRTDSLHLVPGTRRGAPDEADAGDPTAASDPVMFANEVSVLGPLSRDESGNIIVVHTDLRVEEMRVQGIDIFVSSLRPDGTGQCADTPVPTEGVGSPWVALVGSHLVVVDQAVGAGDDVATVLRRYEVDTTTCNGTVLSER